MKLCVFRQTDNFSSTWLPQLRWGRGELKTKTKKPQQTPHSKKTSVTSMLFWKHGPLFTILLHLPPANGHCSTCVIIHILSYSMYRKIFSNKSKFGGKNPEHYQRILASPINFIFFIFWGAKIKKKKKKEASDLNLKIKRCLN